MKDWIKDLKDKEIKSLIYDTTILEVVPDNLNAKVLNQIRNNSLITNVDKNNFNSHQIKKRFFSLSLAAAVLLIVLAPIIVFNTFYQADPSSLFDSYTVLYLDGSADILRNDIMTQLKVGDIIMEGDTVFTKDNTACEIQIRQESFLLINNNSEVTFTELSTEKVNTEISFGRLIVNINKLNAGQSVEIHSHNIIASVTGTQFLVEYKGGESAFVVVDKGTVNVDFILEQGIENSVLVEEGYTVFVTQNDIKIEKTTEEEIISAFEEFERIHSSLLSDNTEKINEVIEPIGNNGSQILIPGIEEQGENKEIEVNNELSNIPESDSGELVWNIEKIYKYNNPDNSKNNNIFGFSSNGNFIVAQTQTSLICFNLAGELLWEKTYGESKGVTFMSVPVIYSNKVFISSLNNKVIVIDLVTGKEIIQIDAPGSINFGYKMLEYNGDILIPFPA